MISKVKSIEYTTAYVSSSDCSNVAFTANTSPKSFTLTLGGNTCQMTYEEVLNICKCFKEINHIAEMVWTDRTPRVGKGESTEKTRTPEQLQRDSEVGRA